MTLQELIDDILIVNWIAPPPPDANVEQYESKIHELIRWEIDIYKYFEHERLMKLNDFYGYYERRETNVPF